MFKRSKVCTGVLVALGGALTAGALPSFAQDAQRIEITGSLIRRIDGETSLPVTNLKTEDLQRAGATNAESIVKFITQQQGGTVTSGSVSGTNGAAAYVDLRSLGAKRTLVLLNGKRVVPNPFSSAAVDLNLMPTAAVDRVETLSDGASATYGTDAIAGVVNFITKKSYRGFAIGAQAQVTEHGGADVYTGDLVGGIGNLASQGWNIYGAFNYRDQKPMLGIEREFMRTSYQPDRGFNGLSPTTFPANYNQSLTVPNANPALATGCQPPTSIPAPAVNNVQCFADTQQFTQIYPIQKQWGAFVKGSLTLGANHTASVEYFKAYNEVRTQIAPSPEGGLTLFSDSPYYPTNPALDRARPVSVAWRTTVLNPRQGMQQNDTQRAVASLDGSAMDWDYSASALWSNSVVTNEFLQGYPATQALRNGVSSCAVPLVAGACPLNAGAAQPLIVNGTRIFLNPFGAQSPEGLAYLRASTVLGQVQEGEGTLKSVTGTVSRSFGRLSGGPIALALIGEYREEEMVYKTNIPLVSQAASSGLAGSGAIRQGDRDVTAVGGEISFPFTKALELSVAVRHDKYSDFGSTTNPKISLRFKPIDQLVLRASANTGFSAPTLSELYAPQSTTFTANRFNDPVLCPGGVVTPVVGVQSRDCGIQFQRLIGGNPNLTAEESTAWTVGFVIEPFRGLSFGVDFWNYHLKGQVSTVGEQTVFGDAAKYAPLFVRCSQAPAARQQAIGACQTTPGDPLAYIIDTNANLGDTKTEGADLSVTWASGATSSGRWGASLRGTYVHKYQFQVEPSGRFFTPVGNYNPQFAGPVIRYQQVAGVTWDSDAVSVRVGNRFLTGYRDQNAQGVPFNRSPFNDREVASYSLYDVSATYRGFKGLTLGVGVLNLLDKDPPFSNQTGRFQARAYDDRFSDPRGRTYQANARYEF